MILRSNVAMPELTAEPSLLCLRPPVHQVFDASRYLDAAVTAHLAGRHRLAEELILAADMPEVREWTESLWGKASPYVRVRKGALIPPAMTKEDRVPARMPNAAIKYAIHLRDGFNCRYCGVPVIRVEVRKALLALYPKALRWGTTNLGQHAGFQALWAHYDHVLPHSRGGDNSLENTVLSCAPCNCAKMNYHLDQLNLADPRRRGVVPTSWDGLERLLPNAIVRVSS
jgi:5-methylcytosine-specific restriction endonuclease McrA